MKISRIIFEIGVSRQTGKKMHFSTSLDDFVLQMKGIFLPRINIISYIFN